MPSEKTRSNCSDAWKRSPKETVSPLGENRFSTLEPLLMTRFDTDAYTLDTLAPVDPKRPELRKLAKNETKRSAATFVPSTRTSARDAPKK